MKKLLLLFCILSLASFSQNWDAFNKNYRYNYKYNNAALITNVLFADSIKLNGPDTIYHLNRIAVQCSGGCFGFNVTSGSTPPLVVPNMPQFLQRKINRLGSGEFVLSDTTNILIKSKCTLGQTWIFDTTYSQNATCIAIGVQNIFGVVDSVKTIMLNNTDTVKLSKSFGLFVFPDPYGKNKYYRLVGIEDRHSYDPSALFGIKVPNAWDFYDFKVGDSFCHSFSKSDYVTNPTKPIFYQNCSQFTIVSKTVTASGYDYLVDLYVSINSFTQQANCQNFQISQTVISFKRLYKDSLIENQAYPGKLVSAVKSGALSWGVGSLPFYNHYQSAPNVFANVASLVGSQNGQQFKVWGKPCNIHPFAPKGLYRGLGIKPPYQVYYSTIGSSGMSEAAFGTGLGFMGQQLVVFEFNESTCNYCGPGFGQVFVDFPESHLKSDFLIWPNPTDKMLFFENELTENGVLNNMLGQEVAQLQAGIKSIDCSSLPTGVYLLKLNFENTVIFKKIVVQH